MIVSNVRARILWGSAILLVGLAGLPGCESSEVGTVEIKGGKDAIRPGGGPPGSGTPKPGTPKSIKDRPAQP